MTWVRPLKAVFFFFESFALTTQSIFKHLCHPPEKKLSRQKIRLNKETYAHAFCSKEYRFSWYCITVQTFSPILAATCLMKLFNLILLIFMNVQLLKNPTRQIDSIFCLGSRLVCLKILAKIDELEYNARNIKRQPNRFIFSSQPHFVT